MNMQGTADSAVGTAAARDAGHMTQALRLAAKGLYSTDPNPRVGCVIVKDEVVAGTGWHREAGGAHAEVAALEEAGASAARGATVYVTLEPCCHHGRTSPCVERLIAAGVARVVAAAHDPNPQVNGAGVAALKAAGISVDCGVQEAAARALNPGFYSRFERGRPFVRMKSAASVDGATAMASGESQWITSEAARADVQRWRAQSSAVMTGIGTVLADNPRLDVRFLGSDMRRPLRVVVDSNLRLPAAACVLTAPGELLILTVCEDAQRIAALRAAGAEVLIVEDDGNRRVALPGALAVLATRGINELLVECGATLSGALLAAGLVDEWILYLAPRVLGQATRGLANVPGITRLADGLSFAWHDVRRVGEDVRVVLRSND